MNKPEPPNHLALSEHEYRESHQIPIHRLEIALVMPVLVQARKRDNDSYFDPQLDPTGHDFLTRWAEEIKEKSNSIWSEVSGAYPPKTGLEASRAYSEFCYFHPFVRNFLYVTRGDIRERARQKKRKISKLSTEELARLVEDSPNRNLRILERKDISRLGVEYAMDLDGQKNFASLISWFEIDSCWLYLFDTQVAMLELRLIHQTTNIQPTTDESPADQPLDLRILLKIQDIIRRVYSPYWTTFEPKWAPGSVKHEDVHVPMSMTLEFKTKNDGSAPSPPIHSSFGNFQTTALTAPQVKGLNFTPGNGSQLDGATREAANAVQEHLNHVYIHREPYTVEIWREILSPLNPSTLCSGVKRTSNLNFEHIRDERTMLMSHIAVGIPKDSKNLDPKQEKCDSLSDALSDAQRETIPRDVRRIRTGDWLRLAAIDDPGESASYPYSPVFFSNLENPLEEFAYDRFWHPTGMTPGQESFHSTRWLCSGYGFSAVGDASNSDFFMDEHAGALCHFRHHYFALGMIAQFHHASLLNYKHRLAEAADAMISNVEPNERIRNADFRQKAELLAKELMRFRTLYWFSEVSNQSQGAELFRMYRHHLKLGDLFDDVCGDSEAAVNLLRQWDNSDQAAASQSLALLGVVFLVFAPFLNNLDKLFPDTCQEFGFIGIAVLTAGMVLMFTRLPSSWLVKDRSISSRVSAGLWRHIVRVRDWLRCALTACLVSLGLIMTLAAARGHCRFDSMIPSAFQRTRTAPAPQRQSALPPSNSSKSDSGLKSSASDKAPQKPNAGKEPPDQDSGGSGDAATNSATNRPSP